MNTADTPTILVIGSQGRLGAAAVQAFAAADWRVLAQARRPQPGLPAGAQALAVPLADTAALAAAARGARAVLYAANPAYTRWPQELLPLARQGMDVAEALGARFLLPGNVYNFGSALPAQLTLDTPEVADTRKGALRVTLEAELRQRAQAGRLRSSVLRAGDFFGGGPGSWIDLVIAKHIASGRLDYPGPMDLPHAWAYLPDLARTFVDLAAHAEPRDFARWQFAGHTLTGATLLQGLRAAAEAQGLTPARGWRERRMAWWPIRLVSPLVPMAREIAEMAYLWQRPHALVDALPQPAAVTPLATAMAATVRALQQSSWSASAARSAAS
jgi:nucleoside-diphosphate-sugar epimerase